ncbi:MAG: endonuclease/exonuclease/phosphatase family protein [Motiliproteus sp.]
MMHTNGHPRSVQAEIKHIPAFEDPMPEVHSLKLLSFNIQVGIHTHAPHHYVTRGWQHLLPNANRYRTLDSIARVIADYDVVALQEIDGGSFRSGFVNQVHYLASRARFPYWYQQLNRNLGKMAQHSNGLLSRLPPANIEDHRLPGLLPGRGAICVRFGQGADAILLVMLHLSLGQRSRFRQLGYLRQLIGDYRSVVVMGDLNCHHDILLNHTELRDVNLQPPRCHHATFPSWKPTQALDHILVSADLQVLQSQVLNVRISDHLPIALEIKLPPSSPPL